MYDTAVATGKPAPAARTNGDAARRVTRPAPRPPVTRELDAAAARVLRRVCDCGGRCGGCGDERDERTLRRAGDGVPGAAVAGDPAPASVLRVLGEPGRPLDPALRVSMEERLGHDLARVRVHDDAGAAASAAAVGALAYTVGDHVVFGAGRYGPGTPAGDRLLAHELTHVVQQRGAPASGPVVVGDAGAAAEHEADRVADGVAAPVAGSSPAVLARACGAAVPASTACVAVAGDPVGDRFLFRVNCDEFASGEAARLSTYATAVSPGDTVSVHGFASVDGPAAFNERLSCARALRAQSVLSAALTAAGVSATVRAFMHGETPGPAAERRSVVVTRSSPPPPTPSPPPAPAAPVSCAGHVVGSRGACAAGTDFTFFDFPALTGSHATSVAALRHHSDADLRDIMEHQIPWGITTIAGTPGRDATAHFVAGSGSTVTHGSGSTLGTLAASSTSFLDAVAAVKREIQAELRTMASTGSIDCTRLAVPAARLPAISFGFTDGVALKAVIGGTQCMTVSLTSFTADPVARTYAIGLRFEIGDDFGVDTADLYADSLRAFWLLQHERSGPRPFVNMLDLTTAISGSF